MITRVNRSLSKKKIREGKKRNFFAEWHNRPFYRYGGHIELIRF